METDALIDLYDGALTEFEELTEHGRIVGMLAVMLAQELEMDKGFCEEIAKAADVHDIGKMQLGKYLYQKRNEIFGVKEINYIRMHPKLGYELLKAKGAYSDFILDAVLYHHENFDGTGYPMNLKGNEIPFAARILRICDVFAALISPRAYRQAYDVETALQHMIEEVKNYDMHLMLALFSVVHSEEFGELIEKINAINNKGGNYVRVNEGA